MYQNETSQPYFSSIGFVYEMNCCPLQTDAEEIKTLFTITLSKLLLIPLRWILIEPLGGIVVRALNVDGC